MTDERALVGVAVAVADGTDPATVTALREAGARLLDRADVDVLAAGEADVAIGQPGQWTTSPTTVAIRPTVGTLGPSETTIFAAGVDAVNTVLSVLAATTRRPWPADARFAASPQPVIAVPVEPTELDGTAMEILQRTGARIMTVPRDGVHPLADGAEVALVSAPQGDPDTCSVTVPCGSGFVTIMSRAFDDAVALDVAALVAGVTAPQHIWPLTAAEHTELVVFGAHLRGGALAHQLTDLGARWAGEITTSDRYRMTRLPTTPPKPAVTRVSDVAPGTAMKAHRWLLSPAALGRFLVALPAPMQLGKVEFDDGSWRTSFGCDGVAADGGIDISRYGGWEAAIAAGAVD